MTSSDAENVEYYNSNIILSPTKKLCRRKKPFHPHKRSTNNKRHFRVCTIENAHISSEKREIDDEADFSLKTLLCKQRISKPHLNGWKGKNQHFLSVDLASIKCPCFWFFHPFQRFLFLCPWRIIFITITLTINTYGPGLEVCGSRFRRCWKVSLHTNLSISFLWPSEECYSHTRKVPRTGSVGEDACMKVSPDFFSSSFIPFGIVKFYYSITFDGGNRAAMRTFNFFFPSGFAIQVECLERF